jgi:hypothetical protein
MGSLCGGSTTVSMSSNITMVGGGLPSGEGVWVTPILRAFV